MAPPQLRSIRFFLLTSITAFFATFHCAYHSNIINIPAPIFRRFINESLIVHRYFSASISEQTLDTVWGWIVSLISIGALIGSLLTPWLVRIVDDRKSSFMFVANLLAIFASVLMMFSQRAASFEMLAVGRFVIGVAAGIFTTLLPVYLSECSPNEYRGLMGTLQSTSSNVVGIFAIAISTPNVLGNERSLPILLSLSVIPAIIQMVLSFFLMESPKYLYIHRGDRSKASRSLRFWSASSSTEREIDQDRVEKTTFDEFDRENRSLSEEIGFWRAMKHTEYRRMLWIAVVVVGCLASTGISALASFSADMFAKLDFDQGSVSLCTNLLAVVSILCGCLSGPLIKKCSRRGLFFSSYSLLICSLILITVFTLIYERSSSRSSWSAYAALAAMFCHAISFNIGPAPLSLVIPTEVCPQAIRPIIASLACSVYWLLALITTFAYPPLRHQVGAVVFLLYAIPLSVGLMYLYRVMPETAGKSIAEIVAPGENGRSEKEDLESSDCDLDEMAPLLKIRKDSVIS